jgi:class 3 adenylate cyclase
MPATTHKLSAIAFADIAGYTALMEKDEEAALKQLHHFEQVLRSEASNF